MIFYKITYPAEQMFFGGGEEVGGLHGEWVYSFYIGPYTVVQYEYHNYDLPVTRHWNPGLGAISSRDSLIYHLVP